MIALLKVIDLLKMTFQVQYYFDKPSICHRDVIEFGYSS